MTHAFLRRPSAGGARQAYPLTLAVQAFIARGDAAETAAARRAGSGWLGECTAKIILAARCLQTRIGTEAIDGVDSVNQRLCQTGSLPPRCCWRTSRLCKILPHLYGRPSWHTPPAAPQSVASRRASVAAAFKSPASTARQTTRNPRLGPQPLPQARHANANPRLSPPRRGPPTTNRPGRP